MTLRPMTMQDADKMLEWKNYPETRAFAIASGAEIKKEDHYKWLEKNIQHFQVMEDHFKNRGGRIGALRIQDNEISIWVDKEFWNLDYASRAINMVAEIGMTAKIVVNNIRSIRAFINAGFKPVDFVEQTFPRKVAYHIFRK